MPAWASTAMSEKLYYAFFWASMAGLTPFLNIYLQAQGLSGRQIGWFSSVAPMVALLAGPLGGMIADRWQIHRQVLAFGAIAAGAIALCFLLAREFWGFVLVLVIHAFFRSPVIAIVDSMVMQRAELGGPPYGHQRLWGTVSYVGVMLLLSGVLDRENLSLIFWVHAICLGVGCAAVGFHLPLTRVAAPVGLRRGLGLLLGQRRYIALLLAMMLLGAGIAAYSTFLGLHLLAIQGAARHVAWAVAAGAVLEIAMMYFGVRWFAGRDSRHLIIAACIGLSLVWVLLGLCESPGQMILVNLGTGIGLGVIWVEVVVYASAAAPRGYEATAQTVLGAVMNGLGCSVGAVLAGHWWETAGGPAVFFFASFMAFLAAGILLLGGGNPEHLHPESA